ncbi:CAP domain-containing protein [Paenibacillus sp. Marseille-Q7038]
MKKNVLKKTIIAGSLSAVLAAGMLIPGAGLASAHSLSTQKGQSYSEYIQQWLQQNGYTGGTVQKPQSGSNNNSNSSTDNNSTSQNQSSSSVVSAYAKEVVSLVNKERAKAGLKPLVIHTNLTKMAVAKAQDMNDNNYFSHTSPTYGSPFDMMKKFGITYKYAGENIAKGQKTPAEVVKAWMNSPGHKANIMNENFTLIGVGYVNGYWVQAFVGK